MAKMRAAQITGPNGPVESVEREIPEPGDGQVRERGPGAVSASMAN